MRQKLIQFVAAFSFSFAAATSFAAETKSTSTFDTPAPTVTTKSSKTTKVHKVLVVMTNHSKYPSRDDTTGLWLTELTHFYEVFNEAGIPMDFVSPKGGHVPLDERSLGWLYSDKNSKALLAESSFANQLGNSKAAAELNPEDYDVIFLRVDMEPCGTFVTMLI